MSNSALILVAAGRGERAGGNIPKQYQIIAGKPLLAHTLLNLTQAMHFDTIIVVVAKNDIWIADMLDSFNIDADTTQGGATRTASVRNGLEMLTQRNVDTVYIHDAARPFVSEGLLSDIQNKLNKFQAVAPALHIPDALKDHEGNAVDRDQLVRVQTPQAFQFAAIYSAFQTQPQNASFADDIAVAKQAGLTIGFSKGSEQNFKVTYPDDFAKAEHMMDMKTYIATGQGFDVHQVEPGETLWLCGVEIAAEFSLKGHSDADVGLHALTDAILGALADGDIGDHFPPSDPQWKGAASDKFLEFAAGKVKDRGGKITHVDVTLICEKPKVKPHRAAMRERIAEILNLPLSRVSVKATTTEKLGFTGRSEGLAAQATATLELRA